MNIYFMGLLIKIWRAGAKRKKDNKDFLQNENRSV